MKLGKTGWYLILLVLVIVTVVSLNELGYGAIAFPPLMLLGYWLMQKLFEEEKPK